jgi:hypothetical protein
MGFSSEMVVVSVIMISVDAFSSAGDSVVAGDVSIAGSSSDCVVDSTSEFVSFSNQSAYVFNRKFVVMNLPSSATKAYPNLTATKSQTKPLSQQQTASSTAQSYQPSCFLVVFVQSPYLHPLRRLCS